MVGILERSLRLHVEGKFAWLGFFLGEQASLSIRVKTLSQTCFKHDIILKPKKRGTHHPVNELCSPSQIGI